MTSGGPQDPGKLRPIGFTESNIVHHTRDVHIYHIAEQELDNLFSIGTGLLISLPVATAFLSICATMAIGYATVPVESPFIRAVLTVGSGVTGFLGVLFGIWAVLSFIRREKSFRRFKNPATN